MGTNKLFAIGDIHGCAEELQGLLDNLPYDSDSTIVFLGDYVDRGPNSKKVIDIIIDLKQKCNVITLMGNHEAMMIDFLENPSSVSAGLFILNGGSATLASYTDSDEMFNVPDSHKKFLDELKVFYETDEYYFVHAGVPDVPLDQIELEKHGLDMLWIRSKFHTSVFQWDKKIIHGHTVVEEVDVCENRINIDTGCVFQGKLSAIELTEMRLYQVKARKKMPRIFLRDKPAHFPRVATRFEGSIPVYIHADGTSYKFETLNYNEFGLLIHALQSDEKKLEVGDIVKGVIGSDQMKQVRFEGEVVRTQKRDEMVLYGVKMLGPLYEVGEQTS